MTVTVRHAVPGDEPDVVRLVQELALAMHETSPVDEHYVRRYLAAPDASILLAVDERDPVGMLSYSTRPGLFHAGDSGEIESLVVLSERRREGIGTALVRTAMHLMEEAGCLEISVSVGAENTGAQHLYVEAGLRDASMRLEKHV